MPETLLHVSVVPDALDVAGFEALPPEQRIVAHRGFGQERPELTMAAYENAVAQGARAFEVSVHQSSDGVFICHHDSTTNRMTGQSHTIASTPSSTLLDLDTLAKRSSDGAALPGVPTSKVCRIEDVLDYLHGKGIVFVEAKVNTQTTALLDLLTTRYPDSTEWLVGKYFSGNTFYAKEWRDLGHKTWGIYYGASEGVDNSYTNRELTLPNYTWLGVSYAANETEWDTYLAYDRLTLGHVCYTTGQADTAWSRGAQGLMSGTAANLP